MRPYIGRRFRGNSEPRRSDWSSESNVLSRTCSFKYDGNPATGTERDDGVVAQMVEHLLCKQNVVGSIPSGSTKSEVS